MKNVRKDPWSSDKVVTTIQYLTLSFLWLFVLGIDAWIINLILLSYRLHDVPGASIAISVIAIPVFLIIAVVLTYVFWGLHSHEEEAHTHEDA